MWGRNPVGKGTLVPGGRKFVRNPVRRGKAIDSNDKVVVRGKAPTKASLTSTEIKRAA